MDWTLFKHVNDFQQHTGWAHSIMRDFAKYGKLSDLFKTVQ